jgi:bifunctional non-homologous end joining protein LigD
MLAGTASGVPDGDGWTFEPKYDGMRVLAYATPASVQLVTRNGIDRAPQFPEVVHALRELTRRRRRSVVLDGEIVVRRAPRGSPSTFQALQARWHVSDAATIAQHANRTPVDLVAFDLLFDGSERITGLPWTVRRQRLERLLTAPLMGGLRLGRTVRGRGDAMLQRAVRLGWEGLIAKRVDSPYRPARRTRDWLKLKVVHEQEFVVGGWTEPQRSREHIGALLLGYWQDGELVYAGHTGTGFTRDTLRQLHRRLSNIARSTSPFTGSPRGNQRVHWVRPVVVVVVRFTEWTANGRLRQPVFIGVRDDKHAADVGREPVSMQKRYPRERSALAARAPRANSASVATQLETLEREGRDGAVRLGSGQTLAVSNLGKVYFPGARLTKGHVMRYYSIIAPVLLPLIADRPLVLKRFPDGIKRKGGAFYQQSAPANTPEGVRVARVRTSDGMEPRVVAGDLTTLLYGVQLGAIEVNPWHSRIGSINHADYLVLDLDPGPRCTFAGVVQVALWTRDVLAELRFGAAVKTSGGRGMHIYLRLPPRTTFRSARIAADILAHRVAAAHPGEVTLQRALKERPPNAIYLDVGQNDRGKSVAAPFSLRAREPGPVSTPLEWDELTRDLDPASFTMDSVLPHAERRARIWRQGLRRAIAMERLAAAARTARRSTRAAQARSAA